MARSVFVAVVAMLVLVPACGGGSARPEPTQPLLSVLEARDTPNPMLWNTVVIADVTGRVHATASFVPLPAPFVGCAGAVLPTQAYAVAGKVFYAAGDGYIRALGADGKTAVVTRVPLPPEQRMLSFAVSPNGRQVLVSVFSLPPKPTDLPDCGRAPFAFGGPYSFDVYEAQSGGAARLLYHEIPTTAEDMPLPNVMAFIGWDSAGPLATYPTLWATQGGGPMRFAGIPVRVDASTGRRTAQIANPDQWRVLDMAGNGDVLCQDYTTSRQISLRGRDGTELWSAVMASMYSLALLSPDENSVAVLGMPSYVVARDGTVTPMTDDNISGWLDSQTIIAGGVDRNLVYISLAKPRDAVDTGLRGQFVGPIRG